MKLFFYDPQPKSLELRAFLIKRKERKLQYQWYHNFRSYLVRMTGLEPACLTTYEPKSYVSANSTTSAYFIRLCGHVRTAKVFYHRMGEKSKGYFGRENSAPSGAELYYPHPVVRAHDHLRPGEGFDGSQ